MATLRRVEFYPYSGFPDRSWDDDPENDAFAKAACGVVELYSARLAALELTPARAASLRLNLDRREQDHHDVRVSLRLDVPGWEVGTVVLPIGVALLSGLERALLVLDVIDAAMRRLATFRGWPTDDLDLVREHVKAPDLVFTWASAWKMSPDRRHRARASFVMNDDGTAHVRIEVAGTRADGREHSITSAPALTWVTLTSFKEIAHTLRWKGSDKVSLDPMIGPAGIGNNAALELSPKDKSSAVGGGEPHAGPGPDAGAPTPRSEHVLRPAVTVMDQPSGARIVMMGGISVTGVPVQYRRALDRLLEQLEEPPWLLWWSGADLDALEIWYSHHWSEKGARSVTRRGKNKLMADIQRPVETFQGQPDLPKLALQDVTSLVEAIGVKMKLAPPPTLRPWPSR